MRALILAAGRGERLRPLTDKIPKPAIPFLNIPIIGFPLFYLEQAGLSELAVNTHHLPEQIRATVGALANPATRVYFSHEPGEILGSGGGLAKAAAMFGEGGEILIANADAVALFPSARVLTELVRRHRETRALATLLVCHFPPTREKMGGVYVGSGERVVTFSKKDLYGVDGKPWHFTGYMVVSPELLDGLNTGPSNILYDVLLAKIQAGALVSALCAPDVYWFETGNPADYLSATGKCLEILTQDGTWAEQCLEKILDRFTPDWEAGFHHDGAIELLATPRPRDLHVTHFAVAGPQVKLHEGVALTRAVLAGNASPAAGQAVTDQILI